MNNTYIQDKLLEKHICRFNDGECNCDCYIAGMTDYHNHIVEKLLKHFDKLEHNDTNDSMENWRNYKFIRNNIVDCLQDTNLTNS